MKTMIIATTAILLATSAHATGWPGVSPRAAANAEAAAASMAAAGASSESIALGLVKNHNVTSVQTAMDIANKVTQNQHQHQGQGQGQAAVNGGNTLAGGDTVVEGTEIPSVTAGFHFQAPNLAGRAPTVAPGAPEVALNRGVSTLLGALQWDELETTHSGAIAWLSEFFTPDAVRAYLCNEVDGIAEAVRAANVTCPGDTIGDLR